MFSVHKLFFSFLYTHYQISSVGFMIHIHAVIEIKISPFLARAIPFMKSSILEGRACVEFRAMSDTRAILECNLLIDWFKSFLVIDYFLDHICNICYSVVIFSSFASPYVAPQRT